MSRFADEDAIPSIRDPDILREAVAGRRREIDPKAALAALLELAPEHPGTVVADLLLDPGIPTDERTSIAAALGADTSSVSRSALIEAVRSGEPPTRRRAALSLGRVGKPEDLEELAGIRIPTNTPAGGALGFARRLISYRHALGSHRFRIPSSGETVAVTTGPVGVPAASMGPAELAEAQLALRKTLPDVRLAGSGVSLSCRGATAWVVPTRPAVEDPIAEGLGARDAVAAIVFRQSECPEGAYPSTFILSHPTRGGGAALIGVSTTGVPTYAGSVGNDGGVRIATLDTPRTIPFELEATLDTASGRLEVIRAVAARRRASGQTAPKAVTEPSSE